MRDSVAKPGGTGWSIWLGPALLLFLGLLVFGRGSDSPPEVAEDARDQRWVSLAPSLTEIVLALGGGDRLVGVTGFCRDVPESVPRVGGVTVEFERLVSLEPDRVLAIETQGQQDLLRALRTQGIPVEVFAAESAEDIQVALDRLGKRLGAEVRAAEISAELAAAMEPREALIPTLFVVERQTWFVAGGGSFVTSMLRAAGLENVFSDATWPYRAVELEGVVARAPVLILDASYESAGLERHWSRFDSLAAVRAGRVVSFPPVQPGLQIPDWVAKLRQLAETVRSTED